MLTFFHALVLALVFEGICFALFPGQMRRAMLEAAKLPDQGLRSLGGMALATAVFTAFALRYFG